jgi:flagellar motility protein MotE (MotC chaperone)
MGRGADMHIDKRSLGIGLLMLCLIAPSQAYAEKGAKSGAGEGGDAYVEPVYVDAAPTMEDTAPTLQVVKPAETGGAHSPAAAAAEGEPAPEAEATPAANALAAEHCVIDITSLVPVEGKGAGDSPIKTPVGPEPSGDHVASVDGGTAAPECVEMVDALPTRVGQDGVLEPLAANAAISATEALLLTRLQERRSELEAQESALLMQEDLLRAAERRLEEQAALLEASTSALAESVDAAAARKAEEIAGLAALFETMKPKDAAAILAGLPDEILVPLAKLVSTRKFAPIMAELPPDRAGALTVLLAQATD